VTAGAAGSRARFIVLEGIDGSGTTTQTRLLAEYLESVGRSTLATREPSAGPVGQLLRSMLSDPAGRPDRGWGTLALLFAADRLDHLQREIEPALAAGRSVVGDRYDVSSLAYQSATAGSGCDVLPWIAAINSRARRPDLTLVIDVEPDVAERRRLARGGVPELFEQRQLQARLAALYASAEQLVPGDLLLHVDGGGSVAEVAGAIRRAVEQALPD
jgi:dTMP kinase